MEPIAFIDIDKNWTFERKISDHRVSHTSITSIIKKRIKIIIQ